VVAKLPEATTRNPPSAGFLLSVIFYAQCRQIHIHGLPPTFHPAVCGRTTSACSLTPSAAITFMMVAKLGLPSADNAL